MSPQTQPFWSGPLKDDATARGFAAVVLAARFATWVRRCKTAYVLVDETTVAKRTSVDFTLPDLDQVLGSPIPAGHELYVPLSVLRKETLAGFSVSDRCANAVSALNRFETMTLAVEGFSALVDSFAGPGWQPGTGKDTLGRIIGSATPEEGREIFDRAMSGPLGAILQPDTEFRALLEELCGGFLLLVPVTYRPGTNHIFKLDASTPFVWSRPRFGSRMRTGLASLGIASKDLQFPELKTGWAQSTHFEFSEPEGVRQLKVELVEHASSMFPPDRPRRRVRRAQPQVDLSLPVGNLLEPASSRSDLATAKITLRSRRSGSLLAITVVACLAAGLQWTLAERIGELDTQTSSAVALVLPALLAVYLVRTEHAIAGRLLAGSRVVGLLVAIAALASALLIGVAHLRTLVPDAAQTAQCTAPDTTAQWPGWVGVRAPALDCVLAEPPDVNAVPNRGVERAVKGLALVTTAGATILMLGLLCTEIATTTALSRARRE